MKINGKSPHVHGSEDLTWLRWQLLPKWIYTSNVISPKIPGEFIAEINKLILKFMWNFKAPRIVITLLEKQEQNKGLTLYNFRTYNKATVIK